MARGRVVLPLVAAAVVVAWLVVGRPRPVTRSDERASGIEVPVPADPGARGAPTGSVDPGSAAEPAPVDWLAHVDAVFEASTTLREKIVACAEASRHGTDIGPGRTWSFAQGVAGDAEFRIGAWDLIRNEQDPDVLLWLGHWLQMGLLGLEPGQRRTGMIPVLLYAEPWQRRRAAVYAACRHDAPEGAPPDHVWSALGTLLREERHPEVLRAGIEMAGDREIPGVDAALLAAAVRQLPDGEEKDDAAAIVARRGDRFLDASRLFDIATTEEERNLWARALGRRKPPDEEKDPESARAFARVYRATGDPASRLALVRDPWIRHGLPRTLVGMLAEEQIPACRNALLAHLAPRPEKPRRR